MQMLENMNDISSQIHDRLNAASQTRGTHNSASNTKRTRLCPGHRARTKWMASNAESADAKSGTLIHAALESGNTDELDEAQTVTAEKCEALASKIIFDVAPKINGVAIEGIKLKEKRFWTDQNIKFSGQADLVVVWPDHNQLLILDYKTGQIGADHASENDQLKALMTCIVDCFYRQMELLMRGFNSEFNLNRKTKITVGIIQPNCSPSFTLHDYVGDFEIIEIQDQVFNWFLEAEKPNAFISPGVDQCKYCAALSRCPEANNYSTDLTAPENVSLESVSKLSQLLVAGELAALIHKANREKAKELLLEGIEVDGWKLQRSKGRDKINAPKVLEQLQAMGLSEETLWSSVNITKTAIKDLIQFKTGSSGQELTGIVENVLDGNTKKGKEIVKLVKA